MTEAAGALRPLILDFGLHKGEDSDFYLACGADVIAFEANQELVRHNRRRLAGAIGSGQLRIVEGAIVPPDHPGGPVTFYVDEGKSVWGTASASWAARNRQLGSTLTKVEVSAIDLTQLLRSERPAFYAKIDIEGADHHVLDAFKRVNKRPEFISIESDKLSIDHVVGEIETLQDLGFSRFAAVQQATVPLTRLQARRFDGEPLRYRFAPHSSGPFGPYLQQDFKTAGAVIDDYRAVFRRYQRFGDQSWLMRNRLARPLTRAANQTLLRLARRPLCGWFDTHAAA